MSLWTFTRWSRSDRRGARRRRIRGGPDACGCHRLRRCRVDVGREIDVRQLSRKNARMASLKTAVDRADLGCHQSYGRPETCRDDERRPGVAVVAAGAGARLGVYSVEQVVDPTCGQHLGPRDIRRSAIAGEQVSAELNQGLPPTMASECQPKSICAPWDSVPRVLCQRCSPWRRRGSRDWVSRTGYRPGFVEFLRGVPRSVNETPSSITTPAAGSLTRLVLLSSATMYRGHVKHQPRRRANAQRGRPVAAAGLVHNLQLVRFAARRDCRRGKGPPWPGASDHRRATCRRWRRGSTSPWGRRRCCWSVGRGTRRCSHKTRLWLRSRAAGR